MSRSTRFFEILQMMRGARRPLTAAEIADALEVSARTVYRDMASLQAMRVPIQGEAGIGYVMRPGYDLPPIMFSSDELEAIVVGLALLGRTGDTELQRSARRAADKIIGGLPESAPPISNLEVSRWHRVPTSGVSAGAMRRFIREETELDVSYVDAEGARTKRVIRPIALVYYIDSVIVAAWCELRREFRHFRIDRLESCRQTGRPFPEAGAALLRRWRQEARRRGTGAAPGDDGQSDPARFV